MLFEKPAPSIVNLYLHHLPSTSANLPFSSASRCENETMCLAFEIRTQPKRKQIYTPRPVDSSLGLKM